MYEPALQSSKVVNTNNRSLSKGKKTKSTFKYIPKNGAQTAMALTDQDALRVSLDRVSSAERKRASLGSKRNETSNKERHKQMGLSGMNSNVVSMQEQVFSQSVSALGASKKDALQLQANKNLQQMINETHYGLPTQSSLNDRFVTS